MAVTVSSKFFRDALLKWHRANPRALPWSQTRDPYKIWLSEIILQQTRVSQGIPYFSRFVKKYPTVFDLAAATEEEVLKEWQGLGYNSRARNLRKAAITICDDFNGYFPDTYDGLIDLDGIGPYTAAAIASFAFGQEVPVVDANVIRIMCRFCGIEEIPGTRAVQNRLRSNLLEMISGVDPAEFNQAIMNFGALQCTPKSPDCSVCPMRKHCIAHGKDLVADLPMSKKRKPRKDRYFHYLVLTDAKGIIMRQRKSKDIWEGMHDFPLREAKSSSQLSKNELDGWVLSICNTNNYQGLPVVSDTQLLTHQKIHCVFYPCRIDDLSENIHINDIFFVGFGNLRKFAVPKIIDCYFRVKSILL